MDYEINIVTFHLCAPRCISIDVFFNTKTSFLECISVFHCFQLQMFSKNGVLQKADLLASGSSQTGMLIRATRVVKPCERAA